MAQANLLQPPVVLGQRIAERWVKLVLEKEMAYGPCLAMWVCERVKLVQKTRVHWLASRCGWACEVLPAWQLFSTCRWSRMAYPLLMPYPPEANVWQGAGRRSLVREAPTTEAQELAGCNKEIEMANFQLNTPRPNKTPEWAEQHRLPSHNACGWQARINQVLHVQTAGGGLSRLRCSVNNTRDSSSDSEESNNGQNQEIDFQCGPQPALRGLHCCQEPRWSDHHLSKSWEPILQVGGGWKSKFLRFWFFSFPKM